MNALPKYFVIGGAVLLVTYLLKSMRFEHAYASSNNPANIRYIIVFYCKRLECDAYC